MLYFLIDTEMTEEQRDYVDTMKRSTNSLLQIIDDVLDFRYLILHFYFHFHIFIFSFLITFIVKYKKESWSWE